MVKKEIPEITVTDAGVTVISQFVDCDFPINFCVKNTGSKTIRLAVYGGYDATPANMTKEHETDGSPGNPDLAAGAAMSMILENPYDYALLTAICPGAGETSKVKGYILWKGHT